MTFNKKYAIISPSNYRKGEILMTTTAKKTTKKLVAIAMAATMMFGASVAMPSMFDTSDFLSISASAASIYYGPSLANGKRIEAYCQSTIKVYLDSSLRTAGSKDGNGRAKYYNACATNNDLIYIYSANSSSCYISYPVGSTRRYGYIRTSDLLLLNYTQNKISSKAKVDAFKQSNLSQKGGEIWVNDTVYVTGKNGSSYRVTFNISGGNWKSMWISQASYDKIRGSSVNNNSSTSVTYPLRNVRCSWRGYNNNTWSWSENRYGSGHTNERVYHLGLDLTGDSTVYACASGTVVTCSNSNSGANGRYVIVQHSINGRKCYSFYAHLSSVSVKNGQSVNNQTKLGVIGGSGYGKNNYYGTHLHFAIVNTLWSNGNYYGYSTKFSGNSRTYGNVTYYNPKYVVEHNALP